MKPIYIKVHLYDRDLVSPDGITVTELRWNGSSYARSYVHGVFDATKCVELLDSLNLDPGVGLTSILVNTDLRDYVIEKVLPVDWKASFLDDEKRQKRVTVFFTGPDPVEVTPEDTNPGLAFIQRIAQQGTGADLQPTMAHGGSEEQMYMRMCEYLEQVNNDLKASANRVLAELTT